MTYHYVPPPHGEGRRRTPLIAVAALLAVMVAVLVVLIGRLSAPATSRAAAPAAPSDPYFTPADELREGVCVDKTLSTNPSFALSIRAVLSRALLSLTPVGPVPTRPETRGGPVLPPQAGVDLTVREVVTNSLSSDAVTRHVAVPAVPGLAQARPLGNDPNYKAWSDDYKAIFLARRAAATAAPSAARTVASLPLDATPTTYSGISACVSGLLVTTPQTGHRSYLVASDLEENVPPQLTGSFQGAPLVVIQPCPGGDAAHCDQLFTRFAAQMRRLDVGAITRVRPEVADQVISQWIHTGTVTQ